MHVTLTLPWLLIIAAAYGFAMKVADLLDEHGLRLFPGADIVFGLLWGALGSRLIVADPNLANVLLAQIIAYVIRRRLDYTNHALAGALMLVTFAATSQFVPGLFTIFLVCFVILGSLRDYFGRSPGRHPGETGGQSRTWLYALNEPAWYYYLPPLIYGLATGNWVIFWVLAAYRTSYNLVKYAAAASGRVQSA